MRIEQDRLMKKLGEMRDELARREEEAHRAMWEARERRARAEDERRARYEAENPPYVTVVMAVSQSMEFQAAVGGWIGRGYRIWGPMLAVDGNKIAQSLIRSDVFTERYQGNWKRSPVFRHTNEKW